MNFNGNPSLTETHTTSDILSASFNGNPSLLETLHTSDSLSVSTNSPGACTSLSETFAGGTISGDTLTTTAGNVWQISNYTQDNYGGAGSNVTFSPANVSLSQGVLQETLNQLTSGTASGAEILSNCQYGYGTYTFSMRDGSTSATPGGTGTPVSGTISSTFLYATDSVTEIDAPEIEGYTPARNDWIEWDIWKNDVSTALLLPNTKSSQRLGPRTTPTRSRGCPEASLFLY